MKSTDVNYVSYGAEDDDTAFDLYLKSSTILVGRGFNLRKFVTNSASLNWRIQLSELKFGNQRNVVLVKSLKKIKPTLRIFLTN